MKTGFRQSMAWLHTWVGLVLGWLLFAMFITGTASYFQDEITLWMKPALAGHMDENARQGKDVLPKLLERLKEKAPQADFYGISLPDERKSVVGVFWRKEGGKLERETLSAQTLTPVSVRKTGGGSFFYVFHFQFHYMPSSVGRIIACIAGMVMFLGLITGIVTHRRIFKDFFTFRPDKAAQRSWLDGHNVLGVLTLPFLLMISYSGLLILVSFIMPWPYMVTYDNSGDFFAEAFDRPATPTRSGRHAPLTDIAPLMEDATRRWNGEEILSVFIRNPGDSAATISFSPSYKNQVSDIRRRMVYRGDTGEFIRSDGDIKPAAQVMGVFEGLHRGLFASFALRALYFLSGMAGTVMIAGGLILWSVKRAGKLKGGTLPVGQRLVQVLNVGTLAGMPLAMGAFFWGNRLLPLDMDARAAGEINLFFMVWALAFVHALFRPYKKAWFEQLVVAAAVFGLIPLLNFVTTDAHLGFSLAQGHWVLAGFDLTMLFLGLVFAGVALKLSPGAVTAVSVKRSGQKEMA